MASGESCLCDFTFDFFWQHQGSRLDPEEIVGGCSRRDLVHALKNGEDVHIKGHAGDRLASGLGVDLASFGGSGGAYSSVGSIIVDGDVGKRMGISMLRGAIYVSGRIEKPLGNVIETETDKSGYRKFISITDALESSIPVLKPNQQRENGLVICDGIYRETVGARNRADKTITIEGHAGMSTGILLRSGRIDVLGSCERNTGALMRGGKVVIMGSTNDFTGVEMRGGEIFIKGDAGSFACAKMKGGSIYAKSGKPIPPASERPLSQTELSAVAKAFDLTPWQAMIYKRLGL